MTATYDYWNNALKGEFGPVHDGDCQPGFWRKRKSRGGPFVPVATWEQDGKIIALVDGAAEDASSLWSYICRYPVTEEAYRACVAGEPWPDEDVSVTASIAPPPAGDNNPPQDEAEVLKAQIDAASANAAEYAEIADDDTAAKAQSARARLNELSGQADKKREAEKKPHLEAGKSIDAKWQPLVKAAKAAADGIAKALSAHETRKARAAAEQQRKVEEARQAALREALSKHPEAPLPVEVAAPPAPVQATIRGAYGRAASKKEIKIATVTDQDAAYGFLKANAEIVAVIAKLAQKSVDAGFTVPGVTVTTEIKVV